MILWDSKNRLSEGSVRRLEKDFVTVHPPTPSEIAVSSSFAATIIIPLLI